jgi:GxxExxY protein
MPIRCDFDIPNRSKEEFGKLDYLVMKHAFASHNEIGRLADEMVYQIDFFERVAEAGFAARREVGIEVCFDSFFKTYRIDVALSDGGVYELKTVASILPKHEAQLRNYLMMLDLSHGKVVNFRGDSVESRFVNCAIKSAERRMFRVSLDHWEGGHRLRSLIEALLVDWGTGLELALYQQALAHLLSDGCDSTQRIELVRGKTGIGSQAFVLSAPGEAVKLTALRKSLEGYRVNLQKLLRVSPLEKMHWINIDLHEVTFSTLKS